MAFVDDPYSEFTKKYSSGNPTADTGFKDDPFGSFSDKYSFAPNLQVADKLQKQDTGSYDGLCQRFVEDATYGRSNIFPSAIDAWNAQRPNAVMGLQGIKKGDLIYFSPNDSNQFDGHVGIYEGNNKFKSATDVGIKDHSIQEWTQMTGQSPLGYVPTK